MSSLWYNRIKKCKLKCYVKWIVLYVIVVTKLFSISSPRDLKINKNKNLSYTVCIDIHSYFWDYT